MWISLQNFETADTVSVRKDSVLVMLKIFGLTFEYVGMQKWNFFFLNFWLLEVFITVSTENGEDMWILQSVEACCLL